MNRSRIAQRYARALFELAEEAGRVEDIRSQLTVVADVFGQEEALRTALFSPVLSRPAKSSVMDALLQAAPFEPMVVNFFRVLLDARKLEALADIVAEYARMADQASGRVNGEAITPMPLDEQDLQNLAKALSKALDKEVHLDARQDPSILGGVVARVGNLVFDGSLRTQLQRMKETLIKG